MKYYLKSTVLIVAMSVGASVAASAAERIAFADRGRIDSWHADDDKTVYLRNGSDKHWYKAGLLGSCNGLRFATAIGYKTEADGSFDKYSSIIVDGRECKVTSLEKSEDPTKHKKEEEKKD